MSPTEENTFDSKLEYIMNEFLSANNDIREMIVANQVSSYESFRYLDKEDVYSLQLKNADVWYVPTNLRNHQAKKLMNY